MAPTPAPAVVPWRTTMRERHLAAPRATAWAVLVELLGRDSDDLSVEPPWRHVRRVREPGLERVEQTVTLRDDGATCHVAWCIGLTAEPDDDVADATLTRLAAAGDALLGALEEAIGGE